MGVGVCSGPGPAAGLAAAGCLQGAAQWRLRSQPSPEQHARLAVSAGVQTCVRSCELCVWCARAVCVCSCADVCIVVRACAPRPGASGPGGRQEAELCRLRMNVLEGAGEEGPRG